jgi:hypothetical protein
VAAPGWSGRRAGAQESDDAEHEGQGAEQHAESEQAKPDEGCEDTRHRPERSHARRDERQQPEPAGRHCHDRTAHEFPLPGRADHTTAPACGVRQAPLW